MLDSLVSLASSSILELTAHRCLVKRLPGCCPGALAELFDSEGHRCLGVVETVWAHQVEIALIDEPLGISKSKGKVKLVSRRFGPPLPVDALGRALDAMGEPLDGLPKPIPEKALPTGDRKLRLDRAPLREQLLSGQEDLDARFALMKGSRTLLLGENRSSLWRTCRGLLSSLMNANPSCCAVLARGELNSQEKAETFEACRDTGELVRMALLLSEVGDPRCTLGLLAQHALTMAERLAFEREREVLLFLDPGFRPTGGSLMAMDASLNSAGVSARNPHCSVTVFWLQAPMPGDLSSWKERADCVLFFQEKDGSLEISPDRSYSRFTG